MSLIYTFTQSEEEQLDAARVVFNNFTESTFNLQEFIKFTITSAIDANNESAETALKLRPNAKLYHRINHKKSAVVVN